jgi:hypothetical protein
MKARVLVTCMLVCTIGCENRTAQSAAPTPTPRLFALPTAGEVFNLRSKCAELADKILENNFVGSALTQEILSHYNPETNRCYVELDVHAADLSQYAKHPISRYLYDGQTKDLLVSATNDKGTKTGHIFNGDIFADYDKATARMDSLMADDRQK